MEQAYNLVEGAQRLRYLRQLEAMSRKPKARQRKAMMARQRRRKLRANVITLIVGLGVGIAFGAVMAP